MNPIHWIKVVSPAEEYFMDPDKKISHKNPEKHGKAGEELINDIPKDVIAIIFSFTSDMELKNVSFINKNFYEASKDEVAKYTYTNRLPMLKLVKEIFDQNIKDTVESYSSRDRVGYDAEDPDVTFGKIFKEEDGTVNVLILPHIPKEHANFEVRRLTKKAGVAPRINVVAWFMDSLINHTLKTTGFTVSILDANMDVDLKELVNKASDQIQKLFLKTDK